MQDWYPISLSGDGVKVNWRYLGKQRFIESFFQDTLTAQKIEHRKTCITDISAFSTLTNSISPTAFIFHISRCGSTLLTQILATLESCVVLSEPPIIDSFFQYYPEATSDNLKLFQKIIHTLGQKRFPTDQYFVIKLDSWHLSKLDFIQKAFPTAHMIFLYRHPQEVLSSHQKQRGPQMIPNFVNMGNLKVDWTRDTPGDLDGYCLRVLDRFFDAGINHCASNHIHLINYNQLPAIVWDTLLSKLHIECSPKEIAAIQMRSQFHSKHPNQVFSEQSVPTKEHLFFKETFAQYLRLEEIRVSADRWL